MCGSSGGVVLFPGLPHLLLLLLAELAQIRVGEVELPMKKLHTRRAIVILTFIALLLKRFERAPLFLFVVRLFFVRLSIARAQDFAVAGVLPQNPGELNAVRGTLDGLDAS